jgi:hypothetical protein
LGKGGKAHADRCIENLIFLPTPHVLPYLCPAGTHNEKKGQVLSLKPTRDIQGGNTKKMHKLFSAHRIVPPLPSSHAKFAMSIFAEPRISAFPFSEDKNALRWTVEHTLIINTPPPAHRPSDLRKEAGQNFQILEDRVIGDCVRPLCAKAYCRHPALLTEQPPHFRNNSSMKSQDLR